MHSYDDVDYFLTMASTGSLTQAAQQLYLSPSALRTFLNKLELDLGTALFLRDRDSLQLTEAGRFYYQSAVRVAALRDDTLQQLKRFSGGGCAELKIGVLGERALTFLERIWSDLRALLPDCSVSVQDCVINSIYGQIQNGQLDFGIGALDYTRQKDFRFVFLTRDEIGLAIPEGHRLDLRLREQGLSPNDPVDISVCRDELLLLTEQVSDFTRICSRYLRRERFTPQHTQSTLGNTAVQVACMLDAVSFATEDMARETGGVVFQRLNNPMYWDRGLFFSKTRELTQTDRQIIALAQARRAEL